MENFIKKYLKPKEIEEIESEDKDIPKRNLFNILDHVVNGQVNLQPTFDDIYVIPSIDYDLGDGSVYITEEKGVQEIKVISIAGAVATLYRKIEEIAFIEVVADGETIKINFV